MLAFCVSFNFSLGDNILEHVAGDGGYSRPCSGAKRGGCLLQASLDCVDGSIAERAHGAADKANDGCLPAGEVTVRILRLVVLEPVLKVRVRREVDSLVRSLSQSRQTDTAIQRTDALLLDDSVQRMRRVSVLWNIQRVGHGVVLRLQPDLDDLHGRHNGHGLGHARRQARHEGAPAGDGAGGLVGEELLVPLKRGEADGHLGDDAGQDGAEALVQRKGGFLLDDLDAVFDEAAAGGAGHARATGELHAHFDCVCMGVIMMMVYCGL